MTADSASLVPLPPDDSRGRDMASRFREGATLEEIGLIHDVTRERVRQILAKRGVQACEGGAALRAKQRRAAKEKRAELACLRKWGMSLVEFRELRGMDERYWRTPIGRFVRQRINARKRGIEWNLTLAEWWAIWQDSGKWDQCGRGGYGMARHGDSGPYEAGNVRISSASDNTREYIKRYWKAVRAGKSSQIASYPTRTVDTVTGLRSLSSSSLSPPRI